MPATEEQKAKWRAYYVKHRARKLRCQQEYDKRNSGRAKERRENNSEEARKSRESNRRWREKAKEERAFVEQAKEVPCADCAGEFPPVVMDFDHVRGEKIASVGVLVGRQAPIEMIEEEMAKCEVVCANCHRLRTDKRRKETQTP